MEATGGQKDLGELLNSPSPLHGGGVGVSIVSRTGRLNCPKRARGSPHGAQIFIQSRPKKDSLPGVGTPVSGSQPMAP